MLLLRMLVFSNTTPVKVLPQHEGSEGSSDPDEMPAGGAVLS